MRVRARARGEGIDMGTLIAGQLDSSGDMVGGFGNVVAFSASTAQKLRCRLLLVQAEWFLDPDVGVPWFALPGSIDPPIMGVKAVDLGYVERTLKTAILDTEGVSELVAFTMSLDRNTRAATVAATVKTDDGDVENIEVSIP